MRIGIIAMGRSGGYNLGQWISCELGYPYKHEPYINGFNTDGADIVVKWLYAEWNDSKNLPPMDKWIGLWRENIRECAISHAKSYQTGEWRTPYKLTTQWIEENEETITQIQKGIQFACDDLVRIPQIELTVTYEGIYNSGKDIQRLLEYLDIKEPKYLHLFDNSLRLRETPNKPKKQLI
jgi:hypothetical protein